MSITGGLKVIGKGGVGIVFQAEKGDADPCLYTPRDANEIPIYSNTNDDSREKFVFKFLDPASAGSESINDELIPNNMKNPPIDKGYNCFPTQNVTDQFISNGYIIRNPRIRVYPNAGRELFDIVRNDMKPGYTIKAGIMLLNGAIKLAEGIYDLNKRGVFHMDVRLQNIAVDKVTGIFKLVDMGSITELDDLSDPNYEIGKFIHYLGGPFPIDVLRIANIYGLFDKETYDERYQSILLYIGNAYFIAPTKELKTYIQSEYEKASERTEYTPEEIKLAIASIDTYSFGMIMLEILCALHTNVENEDFKQMCIDAIELVFNTIYSFQPEKRNMIEFIRSMNKLVQSISSRPAPEMREVTRTDRQVGIKGSLGLQSSAGNAQPKRKTHKRRKPKQKRKKSIKRKR